jgi:hypothetical protein
MTYPKDPPRLDEPLLRRTRKIPECRLACLSSVDDEKHRLVAGTTPIAVTFFSSPAIVSERRTMIVPATFDKDLPWTDISPTRTLL